jgi:hypothetical protein
MILLCNTTCVRQLRVHRLTGVATRNGHGPHGKKEMAAEQYVLVAREVMAGALPPAGRRAEAFVGERRGVRPQAGVEHADDDVSLELKALL